MSDAQRLKPRWPDYLFHENGKKPMFVVERHNLRSLHQLTEMFFQIVDPFIPCRIEMTDGSLLTLEEYKAGQGFGKTNAVLNPQTIANYKRDLRVLQMEIDSIPVDSTNPGTIALRHLRINQLNQLQSKIEQATLGVKTDALKKAIEKSGLEGTEALLQLLESQPLKVKETTNVDANANAGNMQGVPQQRVGLPDNDGNEKPKPVTD